MEELKNCPDCGRVIRYHFDKTKERYDIECNCGLGLLSVPSLEELTYHWNNFVEKRLIENEEIKANEQKAKARKAKKMNKELDEINKLDLERQNQEYDEEDEYDGEEED